MWSISLEEEADVVQAFAEDLQLEMPVLLDTDGAVNDQYQSDDVDIVAAFPQIWLIDAEGRTVYHSNAYQHDTLVTLVEGLLAQP